MRSASILSFTLALTQTACAASSMMSGLSSCVATMQFIDETLMSTTKSVQDFMKRICPDFVLSAVEADQTV